MLILQALAAVAQLLAVGAFILGAVGLHAALRGSDDGART